MTSKSAKLILLRHGQSEWNKKNLFTGWVDVSLSEKGIKEALNAGSRIAHIPFDVIYTSTLIRAQLTAMLAMSNHGDGKVPCFIHEQDKAHMEMAKIYNKKAEAETVPVYMSKDLNERMYGELQGMNKDEVKAQYGEEQFVKWRRSYDTPPPNGESLKMTKERTLPYFEKRIMPHLEKGENVLISAHGNSLRSIVMQLENLSPEQVVKLEIPTGEPLCYIYENKTFSKKSLEQAQKKSA